jgi:hypothetical protein
VQLNTMRILPLILLCTTTASWAQDSNNRVSDPPPGPTLPLQEGYGSFGTNDITLDDEQDTLYMQYGKFFAIGLGLGVQEWTGNRGKLYEPAFPRLDVKVQVWLDFQFALELGLFYASHSFVSDDLPWTANMLGYGAALKYYFDTRDASAPVTFSNPFLVVGAGNMNKTVSSPTASAVDAESAFTFNFGGGLEFPLKHRASYVTLELRYNTVNFNDKFSSEFSDKVPNLTGGFFNAMIGVLFVW